jgi:hypothetical protein
LRASADRAGVLVVVVLVLVMVLRSEDDLPGEVVAMLRPATVADFDW